MTRALLLVLLAGCGCEGMTETVGSSSDDVGVPPAVSATPEVSDSGGVTPEPPTAPVRPHRDPSEARPLIRSEGGEIDPDDAHEAIVTATGAQDQVQIEEELIEEGVEDVEEMNDELEEMIQQLRREKGLPERDPYVSPVQVQYDHVVEQMENAPEPEQEQVQEQTRD